MKINFRYISKLWKNVIYSLNVHVRLITLLENGKAWQLHSAFNTDEVRNSVNDPVSKCM